MEDKKQAVRIAESVQAICAAMEKIVEALPVVSKAIENVVNLALQRVRQIDEAKWEILKDYYMRMRRTKKRRIKEKYRKRIDRLLREAVARPPPNPRRLRL